MLRMLSPAMRIPAQSASGTRDRIRVPVVQLRGGSKDEKSFHIAILLINVLLIVGVFMEALAAIVILTPIPSLVVTAVGVSPLHFGIIMGGQSGHRLHHAAGGRQLVCGQRGFPRQVQDLNRSVLPMIGPMLLVLLLITYVPEVPLFLLGK